MLCFNNTIQCLLTDAITERLKHRSNIPLEIPSPETLLQELTQALPPPPLEKVDIKQEHQPIKIIIKKSVLSPSLTSADAPDYSFEDHLTADIVGATVPASKRQSTQISAKKPKKAKTEEGSDGDEFSLNGAPKPKKKKAPPKPKKEPAKKEPAKKEPAKKEPTKKAEKGTTLLFDLSMPEVIAQHLWQHPQPPQLQRRKQRDEPHSHLAAPQQPRIHQLLAVGC